MLHLPCYVVSLSQYRNLELGSPPESAVLALGTWELLSCLRSDSDRLSVTLMSQVCPPSGKKGWTSEIPLMWYTKRYYGVAARITHLSIDPETTHVITSF